MFSALDSQEARRLSCRRGVTVTRTRGDRLQRPRPDAWWCRASAIRAMYRRVYNSGERKNVPGNKKIPRSGRHRGGRGGVSLGINMVCIISVCHS